MAVVVVDGIGEITIFTFYTVFGFTAWTIFVIGMLLPGNWECPFLDYGTHLNILQLTCAIAGVVWLRQ
jgi:membrane protein DedA with SNARE-associated domain